MNLTHLFFYIMFICVAFQAKSKTEELLQKNPLNQRGSFLFEISNGRIEKQITISLLFLQLQLRSSLHPPVSNAANLESLGQNADFSKVKTSYLPARQLL